MILRQTIMWIYFTVPLSGVTEPLVDITRRGPASKAQNVEEGRNRCQDLGVQALLSRLIENVGAGCQC